MDRGTKGISFLLTSMVFHIIPTALEISMVCGILVGKHYLEDLGAMADQNRPINMELNLQPSLLQQWLPILLLPL